MENKKDLTVEDLYHILHHAIEHGEVTMTAKVMVLTNNPSFGPSAAVSVSAINPGIDWDSGRLLIQPSVPVYTREEETS